MAASIEIFSGNLLMGTCFAEILSAAFVDDPFYTFVFPDPERRTRLLPWLFNKLLNYANHYGLVFADSKYRGISIWLEPKHTRLQPLGVLRAGLFLFPFKVSHLELKRSIKLAQVSNQLHRQAVSTPHFYLEALGVEPLHQGKGLGRALVQAGLYRADELQVPSYLETHNPANLGFYISLGFNIVGSEKPFPSAPQVWGLLRTPQRGENSSM
jgi:ribosomal protein S18 acetylase RimI-like enzyme